MRINFLVAGTSLFGGVKVVLRQADLLSERGHRVTVASPEPPPPWHAMRAEFVRTPDLVAGVPPADVTVATYWTTIPAALRASGAAAHYCQGLEFTYTHNSAEHARVLEAYGARIPALVVAPHLARLLRERFGRPARVVPQPLEPAFRPRLRLAPRRVPRVLVVGPFEIDWKGVRTALEALRLLRSDGLACRVVRLSQWPLGEAERALLEPDEFHEHLPPARVPALVRGCDLLLAPSWEQEGFGLPVLEAMACGVPVVASDVSCYRDFAASAAELVPAQRSEAFADAAAGILGDARRWRVMRAAGLRVARGHADARVAAAAEDALHWIASGAWRSEAAG